MRVSTSFVYQNDRVDTGRDTKFRPHLLSKFALHRCKFEFTFRIVIDDPIDGPVAEVADAVKEYDKIHK